MPLPNGLTADRIAMAVAAGRVALGLTALALPAVPARPWVGATAADPGAALLARALGARDVALGTGALAALRGRPGLAESAWAWVAMGALADALDSTVTIAAWHRLPRAGRWLVSAAAGGAAVAGAGSAAVLRSQH